LTIAQVLELSCEQAREVFAPIEKIHRVLAALCDVGLEYLPLGQASTTLSGGEAQRIKLATHLARPADSHTLFLLDEPTTGLHFGDIQKLLNVLDLLVEKGHTVVVVEHNLDLIRNADWVIDIGPGGGRNGGRVVAVGPPSVIKDVPDSETGRFL
jgi:excinuclease ABC subunit A